MNEFRMKIDGSLVSEAEYRLNNPDKIFPVVLVPDDADPVLKSPQPIAINSYAVRDGVEQDALGNWVERWKVVPYTEEELLAQSEQQAKQQRESAKQVRQEQVEAIQVTTSTGKVFDGDEISQNRMARAIIALQATNTPTVTWVLADNTSTQATVEELTEALALAGAAQAAIWVI